MVTPSLEWIHNVLILYYTMHCIISYQVQLRIRNHGPAESLMICITKLNYFILILVTEVFDSSLSYFLLLPLTDFITLFLQIENSISIGHFSCRSTVSSKTPTEKDRKSTRITE